MVRNPDLPASKFIEFLSSYGPGTTNGGLYDEKVVQFAHQCQTEPIQLDAVHVERIVQLLRETELVHIFVAGVAGDGKSYHLRKVWEKLCGDEQEWEKRDFPVAEIGLPSGEVRRVYFYKDLSAADSGKVEEIWDKIKSQDKKEVVVVACNHGRLLSQLRKLGEFDQDADELANDLEDVFFELKEDKKIGYGINIFDLSRIKQDKVFEEIVKSIAKHPKWADCEKKKCKFLEKCQFRRNVSHLWDANKDQPSIVTKRICSLLQLSALDKEHFPVRELLLLAVNSILGFVSKGTRRSSCLGNCHTIQSLNQDWGVEDSNPGEVNVFNNILGDNLSKKERKHNLIFRKLDSFGIGQYSSPFFDNLFLSGKESETFKEYFSSFPSPPGEIDEEENQDVRRSWNEWRCKSRRQLFFSWEEGHEESLWALTAYSHGFQFLNFLKNFGAKEDVNQEICCRLDRVMTGSSSSSGDAVRIATNGARSREPGGLLVEVAFTANSESIPGVWMSYKESREQVSVPVLNFKTKETVVEFELTPRRYEFLRGLAEGIVPASFTRQCQEEFYSLKTVLINAENKRKTSRQITIRLLDDKPVRIEISK